MSWNEVGQSAAANSGEAGEKVKYLDLPVGTTQIRIFDNEPTSRWSHWIQSAQGGKGMSVPCVGKGCLICGMIAEDKKNKVVKRYNSSKVHSINVINRQTAEINVLDKGNKIFGQIVEYMKQLGDARGYDLKITRTGAGTATVYTVIPVFPPTPLTEADKALKPYDLSTLGKPFTNEQIQMFIDGKMLSDVLKAGESEENGELPFDTGNSQPQTPTNIGVDFTRPI